MIRTSRDIYNEGKRAVYNSYLWIFLNGIVVVVAVMELLSRLVLKRLEKLREVADTITEELSLSLRVPVTRDDEISDLSRSFNVVFGTLAANPTANATAAHGPEAKYPTASA